MSTHTRSLAKPADSLLSFVQFPVLLLKLLTPELPAGVAWLPCGQRVTLCYMGLVLASTMN